MRRKIYAQKGDNRKVLRMERREMDDEERRKKRMERCGEMGRERKKESKQKMVKRQPWRGGQLLFWPPELHPGAVKAIHAVIHS